MGAGSELRRVRSPALSTPKPVAGSGRFSFRSTTGTAMPQRAAERKSGPTARYREKGKAKDIRCCGKRRGTTRLPVDSEERQTREAVSMLRRAAEGFDRKTRVGTWSPGS